MSDDVQRAEAGSWDTAERRAGAERRTKRVYRFIDRRSGFDRRRTYPILGTMRDNPWILVAVLVAANLLSLLDGLLTGAEIALGIASEGNPVLDSLITTHPLLAIAFKVGILVMVSMVIWNARNLRVMLALSLVALSTYAGVLAYHLGFLSGAGVL